jgi:hypothetical protein
MRGWRASDVLLVACHLVALLGEFQEVLRGFHHLFGNLQLQPGFAGGEPALGRGGGE